MKEIIFQDSNGNLLLGSISIPFNAKFVVIISHGFQSSKDSKLYVELEKELNNLNIGTFRIDYYGHGRLYCKNSKFSVIKEVTLTKCVNSVEAAIKFVLREKNYNIGLIGASFGGLISFIVASKNPKIKFLILKSPVTDPIKFWKNRLNEKKFLEWKEKGIINYSDCGENYELNYSFWEDLNKYDTYNMAKDFLCPTLIVHGDMDSVVPIEQSQKLAKILNINVKIIEGANHDYKQILRYNQMKNIIVKFCESNLS